ncbi:MAG: hypothetical protein A2284_02270 [Deltaproteobacteria bacterium RIFOXYA12_FULL_61_11]|nr:MAG: hypothetical protein A2284_02270 [Deltaproteobacteria bacterium RIFOXYA12_FULL_61_11]
MDVQAFALTDLGNHRENNEDSFLVDETLGLFIVADGMGGHAAGEVASRLAVNVLHQRLDQEKALYQRYIAEPGIELADQIQKIVNNAVQSACSAIHQQAQRNPEQAGMGTTVSLVLVIGSTGFVAHVGDSSIHLLRKGALHKVTTDHSLVQERIDRGLLRREDAEKVPFKNVLTRAVGTQPYVQVDTLPVRLMHGDAMVLSSDGLTNYVKDEDMVEALGANPVEKVPQFLVALAKSRGGADNITTVVCTCTDHQVPEEDTSVDSMIGVLKEIPLFQYMEYKELLRLMSLVTNRSYRKGVYVIREGTSGEELFMILSGKVGIVKKEQQIDILGKGDHFGEMTLIDSNPRSASIVTMTETKLLVINKLDLFRLMREDPPLSIKLLWNLTHILSLRLRATNDDLVITRSELGLEQEKLRKLFWEGIG